MSSTHGFRKLALITTELGVGGAERCLTRLAVGIDRRRYHPIVVSIGPRPRPHRSELVETLSAAEVPVHFLDCSSRWQYPIAKRRLTDLLSRLDPDIVQTFLFHANVLGSLAARGLRAGVVTNLRVAQRSVWRNRLERLATADATKVVCVSEAVARIAARHLGFPRDRLLVIPNAVPFDRFADALPADLSSLGIPRDCPLLVCVGRLDRQKGFDRVLRHADRLLGRLTEHRLAIVGEGPQRRRLQRLASRSEFRDRIHLLGWRPDVERILRRAEMLLLPSRWEGMPQVLMEAMAAERPVAAMDVEGVSEILGPLADSQTAPAGDVNRFLEIAFSLCESGSGPRLGRSNRERIADCFDVPQMVAAYQALYDSVGTGN